MKRTAFCKMRQLLVIPLVAALSLSSCSDETDAVDTTTATDLLSINGNSDFYTLSNNETSDWSIEQSPEWITPVKTEGTASDEIRLYVESNSRNSREGILSLRYKDGTTRSVTVTQSDDQSTPSLLRIYAVGWSFDIRTYMDSRGIKDQVINSQKLNNYDSDAYRIEKSSSSDLSYYYGESGTDLADNMSASLNVDANYNSFSLDLQGSFGKTALNNSKRIFCRIRGKYQECTVYLNQFDTEDFLTAELYTADFANERAKVINSGGSDESIRNFINRYGTHIILQSYLGGFYDYFLSSVTENALDSLGVEAAVEFGYASKFNLKADAKYENAYNSLNQEKIEKFSVKGGDAIALTTAVEDGTLDDEATQTWLASLRDERKYELLSFVLTPISSVFPFDIQAKFNNYINRMYYDEIPVTRSEIK